MANTEQRLSFRNETALVFAGIERELGIDPRIALAQAAWESAWGQSQLATEGKNIFSITPGDLWLAFMRKEKTEKDVPNWSSLGIQTVHYPTSERSPYPPEKVHYWEFPGDIIEKKADGAGGSLLSVERHFRRYADWTESAWDWARKISKQPRYALAFQAAKSKDILAFASLIASAGYATESVKIYADGIIATARAISALPMV